RAGEEPRAGRRSLQHDEVRLALRAGRLHALSGDERDQPFPRRFRAAPARGGGGIGGGHGLPCRDLPFSRHLRAVLFVLRNLIMGLVHDIDFGAAASKSGRQVTLTVDGRAVTVPEGTSIMRAAVEIGTEIPKLCATDMLDAFGSCRVCLVEI